MLTNCKSNMIGLSPCRGLQCTQWIREWWLVLRPPFFRPSSPAPHIGSHSEAPDDRFQLMTFQWTGDL